MRTVMFRGWHDGGTPDNSHWVYGDLVSDGENFSITYKGVTERKFFPVVAESVGQFIRRLDNGQDFFEGDIFKTDQYPFVKGDSPNYYALAAWCDHSAMFHYQMYRDRDKTYNPALSGSIECLIDDYDNIEIVGTYYHNPELIEIVGNQAANVD